MKRTHGSGAALLATLLVAAATPVPGQGGLTLKGGLSFGNVSNRGFLPGNLDNRTGFAVGVALGGTSLLGLGIEGLYAQRGVVSSSTPDSSRKLDYVDLPVYLRATLPTPGIAPYAYAGPQFSFELNCRTDSGACPNTGRPKTSYAAVLGAGVRLGATSAFTLEGRYIYGLTDLKLSTVTSSESYQTRSFLILGGISF